MRELLDDEDRAVRWAFLKFSFGSGAFRRQKLLVLHINGAACPALTRGRANQYHKWVHSCICGETVGGGGPISSVSLSVTSKAEVTAEELLARVKGFFVKDDLGDLSVDWMVEDYRYQVKDALLSVGTRARNVVIPKHNSCSLQKEGRQALQVVADEGGAQNWLLLGPDPRELPVVAGGCGGLDEMRACAAEHEKEILTGILRLGFGEGRLRRSKHVLIFVLGARLGVVARGKLAVVRPQMEKVLAQYVQISCVIEGLRIEDLKLEVVIERVRRAVHIDDEVLEGDSALKKSNSVEVHREAVHEKAVAATPKAQGKRFLDIPLCEAITLMHSDASLNWGLFGLVETLRVSQTPQKLK